MMKYHILWMIATWMGLCISNLSAQIDSEWLAPVEVKINGALDLFYAYDLSRPSLDFRQPFLYNHNRHSELNLNYATIQLNVNHSKYRAQLGIHAGTYVHDNYTAESQLIQYISTAAIGLSLNPKNNLWLDAGIMPSHLGYESPIMIDQPTLTRSLMSEFSPYYMAGVKLTHSPNARWDISALVLNGWQRIKRVSANSIPSLGTQIVYKPSDKITINYGTFIGTDDPDESRRYRFFNNFFSRIAINPKLNLIAAFDLGFQQSEKGSSKIYAWYSPNLVVQYAISNKFRSALRAEYYSDPYSAIVTTGTDRGIQTSGLSLNLDYAPIPALSCRIEGRWLQSFDKIYITHSDRSKTNIALCTAIGFKF